MKYKLVWKG